MERLWWAPGVQPGSSQPSFEGCPPRQRAWVPAGGSCPDGGKARPREVPAAWGQGIHAPGPGVGHPGKQQSQPEERLPGQGSRRCGKRSCPRPAAGLGGGERRSHRLAAGCWREAPAPRPAVPGAQVRRGAPAGRAAPDSSCRGAGRARGGAGAAAAGRWALGAGPAAGAGGRGHEAAGRGAAAGAVSVGDRGEGGAVVQAGAPGGRGGTGPGGRAGGREATGPRGRGRAPGEWRSGGERRQHRPCQSRPCRAVPWRPVPPAGRGTREWREVSLQMWSQVHGRGLHRAPPPPQPRAP